jgi:group I intron endonuclease
MYIYRIDNLINGKQYVGITSQSIETRWKWHVYTAKAGSPRAISCAIRKYGEENFSILIVETVDSLEEAKAGEIRLIESYNTFNNGYNMTIGGDYLWENQSQEFKDYHRKRVKEGIAAQTPEEKKRLSDQKSNLWSKMPLEERRVREEKRSKGNQIFWESLSKKDRAKIANPNPRTKRYRLIDPEGNIYQVDNLAQFCREKDLSAPGLNACASGRYKAYKGWKCERVND